MKLPSFGQMTTVAAAAFSSSPSSSLSPFRVRPSIIVFGDSITQYGFGKVESNNIGWVSLLQAAYTRRADIFNRGFSGYNTRDAVNLIPRIFGTFPIVAKQNPNLVETNMYEGQLLFVTVFFGANDATIPESLQHVPIDEYTENLEKIITSIRSTVNAEYEFPIILITPPPIDEEAWATYLNIAKSDRTNERAREYGLRIKDVASQYSNVEAFDTWELLDGTSSDRSKHLYDGLHLNESGNRLVYQGLLERIIQPKYPHLAPMDDNDGGGKIGSSGIPVEEKLWADLYTK